MAKRKDTETASPDSAPEQTAAKIETKSELPTVESPSISPATPPAVEPIMAETPAITPVTDTAVTPEPATETARLFVLRPRHKRYVLLAASAAIAAVFGAVVGVGASSGFGAQTARIDVAAVQERQALEQSIGRLAREVATLRTNLDVVNKSAHSQIARISERVDRAANTEVVTGSIPAPQTATPVPAPRPAQLARPQIVQGWAIRDARDGFVYVQGNGDIYQVVPGAPLPGLGPVESVKQQDGRWVVTTPKGIIVSMRDRRYFE